MVTDRRATLFEQKAARRLLGHVFREARERLPFEVEGIVLLPDHLHAMWTLPSGDKAYSRRWGWIKKEFTTRWLDAGGEEQPVSAGRACEGRRGVWQPKFWEHTIRDETDFDRHMNYIHFNPVKHGYVTRPIDWPWSSLHRWVQAGVYDPEWGCGAVSGDPAFTFEEIQDTVGE